jgi:hypothetical protein
MVLLRIEVQKTRKYTFGLFNLAESAGHPKENLCSFEHHHAKTIKYKAKFRHGEGNFLQRV